MDDSQFSLYGDAQRLSNSVAVKSLYRLKYEKVLYEKEDLFRVIDDMKDNEKFYKHEIESLKLELREFKKSNDNYVQVRNIEKIVDLEREIDNLKQSHQKYLEDVKQSKPKLSSTFVQTDKIDEPLGLIYGAKESPPSWSK